MEAVILLEPEQMLLLKTVDLFSNKYNMPFKNLEINPANYSDQHTDQLSQFYKGFSTTNPTNRGSKLYDFDLIKQDILNHFNTRKGQRVMNPKFGSIIWDLLMEPLTPQVNDLLKKDVTTICNSDPRVYPLKIVINEYEQGFLIEIILAMKNTNQTSVLKLAFDQQIGLSVQ
jgi:phage baseplate assembly protein W